MCVCLCLCMASNVRINLNFIPLKSGHFDKVRTVFLHPFKGLSEGLGGKCPSERIRTIKSRLGFWLRFKLGM